MKIVKNSYSITFAFSNSKRFISQFIALTIVLQLLHPAGAIAHTIATTSNSAKALGSTSPTPISLDLTSTQAILSAALVAAAKPIFINIAGTRQQITTASLLTPSEMAVAYQVANGNGQTLLLGAQGNAVGGTLSIGKSLSQSLTNLVVPQNVKVLDTAQTLNLTGNLTNDGQLIITSPKLLTANAVVNAENISNEAGGLISSGSSNHPLSLTLNVLGDINNAGSISSYGSLSAIAGGSITNALPAGVTGANPVLSARNNVDLISGTGNFVNSGLILAIAGNISVSTQAASDVSLNNTNGVLEARSGSINVRSALYNGNANVGVTGGNIFSQNLNLYSGTGTVNTNVNQLTSVVNVYAGQAHVTAATNDLMLGTMGVTGDPSFYNSSGAISITGSLTFPAQSLAIVAETNITSSVSGSLNTSSTTASGGNITLISGAAFTLSPSNIGATTTGNVNFGAGDSTNTLTITGASATGGYIDLTGGSGTGGGSNLITLNSSSSATNGSGGNVTLIAYNGTGTPGTNAGNIYLPTSSTAIQTGGTGTTGSNGNVTIIAGSTASSAITSIKVGGINAIGGSGGGGLVTLAAATPTSIPAVGGFVQIVNGTLAPTSGAYTYSNMVSSSVSLGSSTASLSTNGLTVVAGGNVNVDGALTANGGISLASSDGSISIGGSISTTGQNNLAIVSHQDIYTTASGITISTSNSSGSSGNILMVAGAANSLGGPFTITPLVAQSAAGGILTTTIFLQGASKVGGAIDLTQATGISSISSAGTSSGNGGNITMIAYYGTGANSSLTPGTIKVPTSAAITTSGNGSGTNGDLTILAGGGQGNPPTSLTAINVGAINSWLGTGGGGVVTIAAAQPTSTGTNGFVSILNGTVLPGSDSYTYTDVWSSAVNLDSSLSANQVTVVAGGNVSVGGAMTANGGITLTTYGASTISGMGTINSTGAITLNLGTYSATLANSGGNITVMQNGQALTLMSPSSISSLTITSASDITVSNAISIGGATTGQLTLDTTVLNPYSNSIHLNGNVTANGGITLNVAGVGTVGGSGTVNSSNGLLALNLGNSPAVLALSGSDVTVMQGSTVLTIGTLPSSILSLAITAGGNITVSNNIQIGSSTGSLSLTTTSGNGSILLSNNLTANSGIALTVVGSGTIGGTGTVSSTGPIALNLGSGSTSLSQSGSTITAVQGSTILTIGTAASSISSLTVTSAGGNISVTNPVNIGSGSLALGSTGTGSISSSGTGSISTTGALSLNMNNSTANVTLSISGSNVTIAEGSSSALVIGTPPSSISSLSISTAGNIIIAAPVSIGASSGTLSLTSTTGTIIGTPANTVSAANLAINPEGSTSSTSPSGSVDLSQSGTTTTITQGGSSLTISNASISMTSLSINAGINSISTSSTINIGPSSSGSLSLTTNNNAVTLVNNVPALLGITFANNVTANGGITLNVTGNNSIGGSGTVTTSGVLAINAGTGSTALTTAVGQLTSTTSGGSINLAQTGAITLASNSEGNGALTVATNANSNITVSGLVAANGGITLSTTGTGIISTSGAGTINSSGQMSISLGNSTSAVTLSETGGNITIAEGANPALTIGTAPTLISSLLLSTAGSITTGAAISIGSGSSGSLSLTSTGGTITGSYSVSASNLTINPEGSAVSLGVTSSQLTLTQGSSSLTIGTSPSSINSLSINAGANSITTTAPINLGSGTMTLTSTSGNINIGNSNSANTITANGGITLTANAGTVDGAGAINSTGPIAVTEGTALTLSTSPGFITITDTSNALTIGTPPASLSSLAVTTDNSILVTSAIGVGGAATGTYGTLSLDANNGGNIIFAGNTLAAYGGITLTVTGTGGISGSGSLLSPIAVNLNFGSPSGGISVTLNSTTFYLVNGGNSIGSSIFYPANFALSVATGTISGNITDGTGTSSGIISIGLPGEPIVLTNSAGNIAITDGGQTVTVQMGSTPPSQLSITSPSVTINSGTTIDVPNFTLIHTNSLVDSGTINSTTAGGWIQIDNAGLTGSLTLSGGGTPTSPSVIECTSTSTLYNTGINIFDFNGQAINITSSYSLLDTNTYGRINIWEAVTPSTYPTNLNYTISFDFGIVSNSVQINPNAGQISLSSGVALLVNTGSHNSAVFGASAVSIASGASIGTGTSAGLIFHTQNFVDNSTTPIASVGSSNGSVWSSVPGGEIEIDSQNMNPNQQLTLAGAGTASNIAMLNNTSSLGGPVEVNDYNGQQVNISSSYYLNGGMGTSGVGGVWQSSLGGNAIPDSGAEGIESTHTSGAIVLSPGITLILTGGNFVELDAPTQIIGTGATYEAIVPDRAPGQGVEVTVEATNLTNNGSILVTQGNNAYIAVGDDDLYWTGDSDNQGAVNILGTGSIGFASGIAGYINVFSEAQYNNGQSLQGVPSRVDAINFLGSQAFSTCSTCAISDSFIQIGTPGGGAINFAPTTNQTYSSLMTIVDSPMIVNNGALSASGPIFFQSTFSSYNLNSLFVNNDSVSSSASNLNAVKFTGTGSSAVVGTGTLSTSGGNIYISASGSVSTGNLTTAGTNGGAVYIGTMGSISLGSINTAASGGQGGAVVLWTGSSATSGINISVGSVTTSGITGGGLVELVNSDSLATNLNALSVGAINTNASGLNGVAGPVALVATGVITATNGISAESTNSSNTNTAELGGGVFISSGSSNTPAISMGTSTVNTSVGYTGSSGNKAGNIIIIAPTMGSTTIYTSGTMAPTNISVLPGNFIQNSGSTPAWLVGALSSSSAPAILSSTPLNITPTGSISISPGGYQANQGTVALTVNENGDSQMLVPINIGSGSGGTSITLSALTMSSVTNNLSFVTAGNLATSTGIVVAANYIGLLTGANIAPGGALTLASTTTLLVGGIGNNALSNGIYPVSLNSAQNILLFGSLNSSPLSGSSGSVSFSAGAVINVTGSINTSIGLFGSASNGGSVTLNASNFINVDGSISTYSFAEFGSAGNGGSVTLSTNGIINAGVISSYAATQLGTSCGTGGAVTLVAAGSISANTINSLSQATSGYSCGNGGPVNLYSGAAVALGSINSYTNYSTSIPSSAGAVTIVAASTINVGSITSNVTNSSSSNGNGGAVTLTAGSLIFAGSISSGSNAIAGNGGAVTLTAGTSILSNTIDSSSTTTVASHTNGGAITLIATASISTGNIYSFSQTHGGSGSGGIVTIATSGNIYTGNVSTGSSDFYGSSANGGAVTMTAGGTISVGSIGSISNGESSSGNGGAITLVAGGPITTGTVLSYSTGNVYVGAGGAITLLAGTSISTGEIQSLSQCNDLSYTSNSSNGGIIILTAGTSISTGSIYTYSYAWWDPHSLFSSYSGAGGSVVAVAGASISTGEIDTYTYGTTTLTAGSVALVAGQTISDSSGINTYNAGTSYAGNIFVSSGASSSNPPAVSLGTLDTSATSSSYEGHIFLGANTNSFTDTTSGSASTAPLYISFALCATCNETNAPATANLFSSKSSTSNPSTIPSTVYVLPTHIVNLYPGIYPSIGSSGSPASIVLDLGTSSGADARTVVPIVSSGGIYLSGFTFSAAPSIPSSTGLYTMFLANNTANGINISGNINSSNYAGNVSLVTAGSTAGGIVQTGGTISGTTLSTLTSGGSIGTTSSNVSTNAPSLIINTPSSAYLTDSVSTAIGAPSTAATLQLTDTAVNGNITVSNLIATTSTVTLQAASGTNGNLAINANVFSDANVNLTANGSGSISQVALTNISVGPGSTLTLSSGTTNGGTLGSSLANILTNAPNLAAYTSNNVYITDSSSTAVSASSSGSTFWITDTAYSGSLAVNSTITASSNVELQATNNCNIAVNATISSGPGGILLTTQSNGNIVGTGQMNTTGGNITIISGGAVNIGNLATTGTNSGNVFINGGANIAVGTINTSTSTGQGGAVVIWAGSASTFDISVSVGAITTSGVSAGGLVEIVNSDSLATNPNALSVAAINTNASGINGVAGPVALVATGVITATSGISAEATNNSNTNTAELGGGVFISSGSSNTPAISMGTSTVNTSVGYTGSSGNKAGNIIIIAPTMGSTTIYTSGTMAPTNISVLPGNFTQNSGSTPAWLVGALSSSSAPAILSSTPLNITPTGSISISPGGYQANQGTVALTVNENGDSQMLIPINIGSGSGGTSITLNSLVQFSGTDNINFVLAGGLQANTAISVGSSYTSIVTGGAINLNGNLTLLSSNNLLLLSPGSSGVNGAFNVSLSANQSIVLMGSINSFSSTGAGGAVIAGAGNSISITGAINSYSTFASSNGGAVLLTAGGSISTGAIQSNSVPSSGASGAGGAVTLTAGTTITTGNISANSRTGEGGAVSITAGSSLLAGNILTTGNTGGSIELTGGGTINTGYIRSYASNSAGNVILVSTGGSISVDPTDISGIVTSSGGTVSGSVALVAAGTISVGSGIYTSNSSSNSYAGNIFVSSGSASTGAVSLGTIDTSAFTSAAYEGHLFAGTNTNSFTDTTSGTASTAPTYITFSFCTSCANTYQPSTADLFSSKSSTNNPSTISSTAIKVYPTSIVTIYPGVYSIIGSSGTPVTITLNLGASTAADSRTIVPIVSTGGIYVSGFTFSTAPHIPTTSSTYTIDLVNGSANGINITNNINVSSYAGNVNITTVGGSSNSIAQTAGTISGTALAFTTTAGNIGTSANNLITAGTSLNANAAGAGSTVYLNQTGATVLANSSSGGTFQLNSNAATTINDIVTISGMISVNNSAGQLAVNSGSTIVANNGGVNLINSNTSTGTIAIGSNVTVQGSGAIEIVIGTASTTPGTPPGEVTTAGSGSIYFGPHSASISASSPMSYVSAFGSGTSVSFNATASLSSITLGGGDSVTATSYDLGNCADEVDLIVDTGEDGSEVSEVTAVK